MDLKELDRFIVVVEAQSMTLAAERLNVTQSAISQTIKNLETKLDTKLIDRNIRPLSLTSTGQIFYERSMTLLEYARGTLQIIRDTEHKSLPKLRLGLVDSFAAAVSPHLLCAHMKLASHWSLWSGLGFSHEAELASRSVDIIFTGSEMGTGNEFERRHVMSEPYVIAVPKGYKDKVTTLGKLAERNRLIRFSDRSFMGQHVEQYLRRLRINTPYQIEFDTSESLMAMIALGMGWAMTTPLCLMQAQVHLENVDVLPLPGPKSRRHLTMINRPNELGDIPDQIFDSSLDILENKYLVRLRRHIPWIIDNIVIGEPNS